MMAISRSNDVATGWAGATVTGTEGGGGGDVGVLFVDSLGVGDDTEGGEDGAAGAIRVGVGEVRPADDVDTVAPFNVEGRSTSRWSLHPPCSMLNEC